MGSVLVLALLALAVGLAIRRLYRNRKAGKGCCGGSCAHCPGCCGQRREG